jgi:hypothetical protein
MTIKYDCYCEKWLHETSKGNRRFPERKLRAGDEVQLVRQWTNLYGTYYRVSKDGIHYDVRPENIQQ